MNVIQSIKEMQQAITNLKISGKRVGFVPTMGYLHEGHQTLMKQARKENDVLVVSIFVNPLQFGAGEDLDAYPRDFERDRLIAEAEGVDILFHPTVTEMYPRSSTVKVMVEDRTDVLCGRSRAGHFDGVATVLTKLFHIVMPNTVYFGLKDAQQVAVVDGLIQDFNFPIELVPVQTVREKDGLAKSSRNVYLTPLERDQAKELYQGLQLAEKMIEQGERNSEVIMQSVKGHINKTCDATIDYVELLSYPQLRPVDTIVGKVILAVAVKFSKARLIDNIIIEIV
jgi:pantoate--beta-alanine ligase